MVRVGHVGALNIVSVCVKGERGEGEGGGEREKERGRGRKRDIKRVSCMEYERVNPLIITHLNRTDKVDEGTRKNLELIEKISALKDHVGGGD